MRARELMSYPVFTCHVNDPLTVPASLMWEHDCGVIPVVNDEGKLTSIITDRDICMAAFTQGRPLYELLVNAAMSGHVITATADQSVEDVERLMAEHQVRRIPVVDADGMPIGIVSTADLAITAAKPGSHVREERLVATLASIDRPRNPSKEAA